MTVRSIKTPEPTLLTDPERQLALSYAPADKRAALGVLWQLDERMGAIVGTAREPAIGAMRLLWWRDALTDLDDPGKAIPAEPLLAAVVATLLPRGLSGHALADLEQGWAALLESEAPGAQEITAHGEDRGAPLFALSGALLGAIPADLGLAGEGWALADLGHRLSDPDARRFARAEADRRLAEIDARRWPAVLKPLGLLTIFARADAAMPANQQRRQGAPKRLLRALAYHLIGR